MAKICQICKKGTMSARNIRHKASGSWERKAHKTTKKLAPNLRTLSVMGETGDNYKIKVCMKCYKKIRAI